MIVSIGFVISKDYRQYLKAQTDSYDVEIDIVNEDLKQLVDDDELVLKYKGDNVKILLPVDKENFCNLLENDEDVIWSDFEVSCEINCNDDFDSSDIVVEECPSYFKPVTILW